MPDGRLRALLLQLHSISSLRPPDVPCFTLHLTPQLTPPTSGKVSQFSAPSCLCPSRSPVPSDRADLCLTGSKHAFFLFYFLFTLQHQPPLFPVPHHAIPPPIPSSPNPLRRRSPTLGITTHPLPIQVYPPPLKPGKMKLMGLSTGRQQIQTQPPLLSLAA